MKETRSLTYNIRQPLKSAIIHPARSTHTPPIQRRTLTQHQHHLDHGLIATHRKSSTAMVPAASSSNISDVVTTVDQHTPPTDTEPQASSVVLPAAASTSATTTKAKAVVEYSQNYIEGLEVATVVGFKEPRNLQTCGKCGDSGEVGCPGRQRVMNCKRECHHMHRYLP